MLRNTNLLVVSLYLLACEPAGTSVPVDQSAGEGSAANERTASPGSGTGVTADSAPQAATEPSEAVAVEAPAAGSAEAEDSGAVDTFEQGIYTSYAFNVRFELPADWDLVDSRVEAMEERPPREGQLLPNPPSWFEAADGMRMPVQLGGDGPLGLRRSYDSLTFVGPPESGLYMVVSGRDSVALGVANFQTLDERVGLSDVSLYDDRSGARTLDGVAAYFVEGTARETDALIPISFQSMSLDIPSGPVNMTILVPQEKYAQCPTPGAACLPENYTSAIMQRVLESMEIVDRGRE